MINDRDPGTDLFYLFHVVRGIDDGRSLTVEFQNPFQNLITALRIENLVDESKTTLEDQYMALAERYMKINCACFTPNEGRIDDILRLAKEYKVDGIIDVNLKFCNLYDTEGYSVEKAMKEAGIPVLGIETDYTDSDAGQLRTRISAFIEMLDNK